MINDIIEDNEYKDLVSTQVKDTMDFLLKKGEEFAVTANVDAIKFNPELPKATKDQLSKFSLFVLSNYTYSTVSLEDGYFTFEAGFGSENFGSTVTVPFHAVFQVVVGESILFVNSVATVDKFNKDAKEKSLNVFKNNPNNKGLVN